jgi:outer membrane protein assembly factor BamD
MTHHTTRPAFWRLPPVLFVIAMLAGCGAERAVAPPGAAADEFLYMRGSTALMEEKWLDARQYFQQIVDNYPQSPRRPDAKLGLGDSYLGEGTTEALVFAANEFREFLQFYPVHARADYAQYKLAMSHFRQMRAPERDQTETRAALREFDAFFERYPDSMLTGEVRQRWREARDRLSEASYRVGFYYFRARWYPGAIDRFKEILKDDPGFGGRDAVYFYLAESLARTDKSAEALPYFERLVAEFDQSEHLEEARKRIEMLKTQ